MKYWYRYSLSFIKFLLIDMLNQVLSCTANIGVKILKETKLDIDVSFDTCCHVLLTLFTMYLTFSYNNIYLTTNVC